MQETHGLEKKLLLKKKNLYLLKWQKNLEEKLMKIG